MNAHTGLHASLLSAPMLRAESAYLYDMTGRQYLDFASGALLGHQHPRIVQAVQRQAAELLAEGVGVAAAAAALTSALESVLPQGMALAALASHQGEAVEMAVQVARGITQRHHVVVFNGAGHGRGALASALSSVKAAQRPGASLHGGILCAPYPYAYRYGWNEDDTTTYCLTQLDMIFRTLCAPGHIAAILIEPVQQAAGVIPAPAAFLADLRLICDQHGIMLIMDETHTAGRAGRWLAAETPADLLVLGESLAGGLPLAMLATRASLHEAAARPAFATSATSGYALACAAALTLVQVISQDGLLAASASLSQSLLSHLKDLKDEYRVIGDVRGMGLMVGVEFTTDDQLPDRKTAASVQRACLEADLLVRSCGTDDHILCMLPPLVTPEAALEQALAVFEDAVLATTTHP
jgi:4-aminobutyrate aminotransferase